MTLLLLLRLERQPSLKGKQRGKLGEGNSLLAVKVAEDGLLNERSVGERERLEGLGVGGGDVGAGDALGGSVEEVEGGRLADLGNDLRSNTKGRETTLNGDEVVGLLDRGVDGVNVERTDRAAS